MKHFERFAELKNIIAQAEEELEPLKEQILAELVDKNVDEFPTEFGKFTVGSRKQWTYPEEVIKLEEQFKKAQEESKQIGTATSIKKPELRFTKINHDN